MRISRVLGAAAVTCGVLLLAVPAFAHHSFAVEFDANNCKDFTGTLTKIDWQNPHGYFFMDIKDASGKPENWSFQINAIPVLKRAGIERQLFIENIGKEIWVRGCLARNDRQNYAVAGTLKFSDGLLRQMSGLQN
jgi:uncharacterized protein DUF6152